MWFAEVNPQSVRSAGSNDLLTSLDVTDSIGPQTAAFDEAHGWTEYHPNCPRKSRVAVSAN